jgi:hypothetical protein
MIESHQGKSKDSRPGDAAKVEKLPYRIELWDLQRRRVERVLARAVSAPLVRAIFTAARSEHPERHITLRRGGQIIAETE